MTQCRIVSALDPQSLSSLVGSSAGRLVMVALAQQTIRRVVCAVSRRRLFRGRRSAGLDLKQELSSIPFFAI